MPIKFKIVFVGSSEQHKEILLIDKKDIEKGETYQTKLGLDFKLEYKLLDEKDVNLVLWLMKGEKYKEIKQHFYEDADGMVVLFDTSQEEDIDVIVSRLRELRASSLNSSILLIGKNIKTKINQIVEKYALQLIKEGKVKDKVDLNIDFFDISEKEKINTEDLLDFLARKLLSRTKY